MNFSDYFRLGLDQSQLDFVDIDPDQDTRLFLDPFALEIKQDLWSMDCGDGIRSYFQELLDAIRAEDDERCQELISHLHEPEETYLGLSKAGNKPRGKGIAKFQGNQILDALKKSEAAETGLLTDLAESALFIENIDRDKISDLTTNIIRGKLLEYTVAQCELHGIDDLRPYGGPPVWNPSTLEWEGRLSRIPYIKDRPVILVPKYAVRRKLSLNSQEFYNHHMLEFLQEERTAGGSLVRALKGQPLTKKQLKERNPFSKQALADFVRKYPEVLEAYKRLKGSRGPLDPSDFDEQFDERDFARVLKRELLAIPTGRDAADRYHNFAIGLLTFLMYPSMTCPVKEVPINQGRKRIDIRYNNGALTPFFDRILRAPQTRALSVIVECKNYSSDIGNEELDQLAGRFNDVRGWFGLILCRDNEGQNAVIERCRDLARDGHGHIVVLTDADINQMLDAVIDGDRELIDRLLSRKLNLLLG